MKEVSKRMLLKQMTCIMGQRFSKERKWYIYSLTSIKDISGLFLIVDFLGIFLVPKHEVWLPTLIPLGGCLESRAMVHNLKSKKAPFTCTPLTTQGFFSWFRKSTFLCSHTFCGL